MLIYRVQTLRLLPAKIYFLAAEVMIAAFMKSFVWKLPSSMLKAIFVEVCIKARPTQGKFF